MAGKKIKTYWYFLIAGVVLFVGVIVNQQMTNEAESVVMELSERKIIIETVSANGKVQPEVEVKISPDVSGEIVQLLIKEGQEVKQGTLLAKINPDIYLSMRERMVAALNTTKANLANSKARLSQANAQFLNSEAIFKRNQSLFKDGAISESEFDAAKSAYEVARAEVESADQSIIAAQYNVKSAEASVKEASDNLLKTTIFAPVDGTVSMLNVEQGERVVGTLQMAGTEMMRIANLKEMEVKVDVNENDIVRIMVGDTSIIEVDAYKDRKFKGIVTQIANSAKTFGLSADQVTNFEVRIRILRSSYSDLILEDKPHLSPFRPGMSATVEIQTKTEYDVISVPIQAVTTREDTAATSLEKTKAGNSAKVDPVMQECVFVMENDKAVMKKVKIGIQDNKFIQIVSGINAGEQIITGPYSLVSKTLKEGDPVVLKIEEEEIIKRK
ncbi:MAG: efflux RND transporter periplasmic adaptor subunit [Bacteroidetes bacterium]|nr:efflux RND transporter periplasmic adaptor subunit [Bacteroidota bacterium]HET6243191.1 efflux RND transporter periplasmic adaptor subunit [Bacteroidia bacterium]